MSEIIWTEPTLSDLDAIADYIALDKPEAARRLVQRVFEHVEQLSTHPQSGSVPRELRGSRYRQIVEPSCRVFYRYDGERCLSSTSSVVRSSCARATFASVTAELDPFNLADPGPRNLRESSRAQQNVRW